MASCRFQEEAEWTNAFSQKLMELEKKDLLKMKVALFREANLNMSMHENR